jgi:transposase
VIIQLSEGQESDRQYAVPLLECVDITDRHVLADKGYDSNEILAYISKQRGNAVIPPKKNRKEKRTYHWWLYKERHLVECFFQKIKIFRRVATRYDKSSGAFMGFVLITSICVWLK